MGYEAPNLIAYLSNNLDCFFKNRRGIIPTNLSAISTSLAIQGRWAESGAILDEIARDVVRDDGVIDRFMLQGGAGDRSRSKSARKKRQFRTSLHDLIGIAWGLTISTPGIAEDEGAQRLDAVLKLRKVGRKCATGRREWGQSRAVGWQLGSGKRGEAYDRAAAYEAFLARPWSSQPTRADSLLHIASSLFTGRRRRFPRRFLEYQGRYPTPSDRSVLANGGDRNRRKIDELENLHQPEVHRQRERI